MIIHFTKKPEDLTSIIGSGELLVRYCSEEFYNKKNKISSRAAHPMVSFSNFLTKTLSNKKVTYGEYGIAFKDKWVKNNNINPVVYMNNDSFVSSALDVLLLERRKKESILSKEVRLAIIKIKCFTKNSYGKNSYSGNNQFNFKKENEWRYVPTKVQIGNHLISVGQSDYIKNKNILNRNLEKYPLRFQNKDIKAIYVPKDELENFVSNFSELKNIIYISPWEYVDISKKPKPNIGKKDIKRVKVSKAKASAIDVTC